MSTETPIPSPSRRPSLIRNWLSLTGLVIAIGSLFSFLLLWMMDMMAHFSNPYLGILTYLVAPAFLILGLALTIAGVLWQRRRLDRDTALLPKFVIDLSQPRHRRVMAFFLMGAVLFLLLSAIGSYQTYHFTESVQFCGETCHTVMEPELVTYQQGSHARVDCVECHIGSGATWFVKSKLSGTYQVYATALKKYPRPIPTPIKNLRPAQETCEQCHWPQKFTGNLERTYPYFLGDETNTPYTVRMLMKVGGGHPGQGRVEGIHWHVGNVVEYYTPDESRQTIPWVRVTDSNGVKTEYRTSRFTNDVAEAEIRRMDCIDCHNRPAHRYRTPNDAVNQAMELGRIDPSIPWIKTNALFALTRPYTNRVEAQQTIASLISERYPGDPKAKQATEALQDIYRGNFFPEMKASYEVYPDNIGHMEWPGCFRCHDGKHKTTDGAKTISASDCNSCHTILSQGSGPELDQLTPAGQPFKHPGDEVDGLCNDCHTGGL